MLPNNITGKKYEIISTNLLKQKGYKILKTNYKNKVGEIDIIALDNDIVVFIEVKYRTSAKFGLPIEAITPHKINKIIQTASCYLKYKGWYEKRKIRFDAIEILDDRIRHIQGIV